MSTSAEPDIKALIENRNAAELAIKQGKEAPAPAVAKVVDPVEIKPGESTEARSERSRRRELKQALEDAAELRGQLKAIKEFGLGPKASEPVPVVASDPEPLRKDFTSEADYNRALGRWDARQEVQKQTKAIRDESQQAAELEEMRTEISEAATNAAKVIAEHFPDYADKAAIDEEHGIKVDWTKHVNLALEMMRSPMRAQIGYYFFDHQAEFQAILDMESPAKQVAAINRLEGRLEKEYTEKRKTAAEADPKDKARTHPAEASAGRNPDEREKPRQPRPSTEVAVRGGSPAPEEPAPGTKAWMDKRNAERGGR